MINPLLEKFRQNTGEATPTNVDLSQAAAISAIIAAGRRVTAAMTEAEIQGLLDSAGSAGSAGGAGSAGAISETEVEEFLKG